MEITRPTILLRGLAGQLSDAFQAFLAAAQRLPAALIHCSSQRLLPLASTYHLIWASAVVYAPST